MKEFLIIALIFALTTLSHWNGMRIATNNYNARCMKYFGNKGYPADGYCKLFIGEIKARDEQ